MVDLGKPDDPHDDVPLSSEGGFSKDPHQSGPPPKYDEGMSPSPGAAYSRSDADDKVWALVAHLSLLVGGVGVVWAPLIIWLIKKDDSPFVEDQAKEALNFHLSVLIVSLVSVITCIGPLIVAVGAMVYAVIAAVESHKGVAYRYPYTFRFIT